MTGTPRATNTGSRVQDLSDDLAHLRNAIILAEFVAGELTHGNPAQPKPLCASLAWLISHMRMIIEPAEEEYEDLTFGKRAAIHDHPHLAETT